MQYIYQNNIKEFHPNNLILEYIQYLVDNTLIINKIYFRKLVVILKIIALAHEYLLLNVAYYQKYQVLFVKCLHL